MDIMGLMFILIHRFGLIIAGSFILMQIPAFRKIILNRANPMEKVFIVVLFGLCGIMGTYMGKTSLDAFANLRAMASITAGLLGGPLVGLGAGLISGVHRFFLGGFTALPCGTATMIEGFTAGLLAVYLKLDKLDWKIGLAFGLVGESFHMALTLLMAQPFSAALPLVKSVAIPMILVNSAGIAVFIMIINTVLRVEEKTGALQAQKALDIATKTIGYLRTGLNTISATQTAHIIYGMTDFTAVAITDRFGTLACKGTSDDRHRANHETLTEETVAVIETGEYRIIGTKPDCPFSCGIIVPLKKLNDVVGTLKLYKEKRDRINQLDVELATGLAQLFSLQLELEEIQQQAQLLERAEIKALQAQINPHFLFNTLNTIASFCRTDVEKARELLIHLGNFFRSRVRYEQDGLVRLEEALNTLKSYLIIEEARFGNRIEISYNFHHHDNRWTIPQFTIQPLVENALKHGLSTCTEGGRIMIETQERNNTLMITIEDNGTGINPERLRRILDPSERPPDSCGIALANINQRLVYLYGLPYALDIESKLGSGTRIRLKIPGNTENSQ
ncbi:MAG TPA: LytS/YhcK type 5TM receptor domain-containing protein [Syntrophales bacterium]|nr:LytS/YhcK type 5TM receptor domain-containing protein [Syntrophales bacterium]HPQ44521.1 LytS/YhcK type 5TM receptor domain-containing protein [Syntrophales bacterium]